MELLNEEEIVSIEINLEELKKNKLNESFLSMFGASIKLILDRMFGGRISGPAARVAVSGSRNDVTSFAKTLGREKRYLEATKKYGLDNPRTFKDKKKLDTAIRGFEKDTGLKWPFK